MKSSLSQLLLLPMLIALAALLIMLTWSEPPRAPASEHTHRSVRSLEPLAPLPIPAGAPASERVALGARLYHDARLSSDGSVSCASCHPDRQRSFPRLAQVPFGTSDRACAPHPYPPPAG